MKPACFDSDEQWDAWLVQTERAPVLPRAIGDETPNFCQDCTPKYQREMLEQRRCAYPATRFALVPEPDDGPLMPRNRELVGYFCQIPVMAERYPYQALKRGSGPSAARTPPEPPGSLPPMPIQPLRAMAQLEARAQAGKELLERLVGVPDKAP